MKNVLGCLCMSAVVRSEEIKGIRTVIQISLQFLFHVGQKTPRLRRFALKLEEKAPVLYLVAILQRLGAHQFPGAFPRRDACRCVFKMLQTWHISVKTDPRVAPGLGTRLADVGQKKDG